MTRRDIDVLVVAAGPAGVTATDQITAGKLRAAEAAVA